IAVLPFTNMSSDPEIEYFGDGIAEEIINVLARLPGLRVAGRSSAFSFKGKHENLRVIGDKLAVGTVLEGSVRKAGAQLRITAQPQARAAARRSVELGPELAEAHNAVAGVRLWDWDWAGADREFRKALQLNPSYVQARCWHGMFNLQWVHGRDEEGIAEAARAVEIEPLDAYPRSMLALALSGARRHDDAVEEASRAARLDPRAYLAQTNLGA